MYNNRYIFNEVSDFIMGYDPSIDCKDLMALQFHFIKEAYNYHYNSCSIYKNYSDKCGIEPRLIETYEDLCKIPLIPSTMFKFNDILSCDTKRISCVCRSSGTKGIVSKVYRDELTINNFINAWSLILKKFFTLKDVFVINLNPQDEDIDDLWIARAMNFIGKIAPMKNFIKSNILMLDDIIKEYEILQSKYENIIIMGAPIMLMRLLEYMEKKFIKFSNCENLYCLTGGGWKKFSGEQISQVDLADKISHSFLGFQLYNMRDMFNMVELNTVWPECSCHHKHIMPWVKVFILNPETLQPVSDGKEGLIAYLDASASSYPCFVLTDDVGKISVTSGCRCGVSGQAVEYIRRVKSNDVRGCALKMERKIL